jgi:hypothetical protein
MVSSGSPVVRAIPPCVRKAFSFSIIVMLGLPLSTKIHRSGTEYHRP